MIIKQRIQSSTSVRAIFEEPVTLRKVFVAGYITSLSPTLWGHCRGGCTHRNGGQKWCSGACTLKSGEMGKAMGLYICIALYSIMYSFLVTILMKVSKNCDLCIHQYDNKSLHSPNCAS